MYESQFSFSQRPFAAPPKAEAYIPTGSLEQARQTLIRCIERAEGPAVVMGPAGTGKSLLCQILAAHFRGGSLQVAHLAGTRLCTRRALLQNILFELKLPYRDMDDGELGLSLVDHLEPRPGGPDGMVLLVDEAHALPLRLLDEIRLLTNIARDGQSRVRLALAGGMVLEERLSHPKLASFQQRIAARCYLQPLGRDETIYYVQEQIRRCGSSADGIFTGDAQAAIHTATDGIPRLINQVCDHVLLLAALGGQRRIDASGIEEAWADLQQLPLPLHEPPALVGSGSGAAGGVIEFGQLSDVNSIVANLPATDVAVDTVAQLDSISRTIDALHETGGDLEFSLRGAAAEDFSPALANGTEVELYFHGAHDPFGGNWDEEEVVIDRYASLEDAVVRSRRVTSQEGRSLGAAISAVEAEGCFQDDEWARATIVASQHFEYPAERNGLERSAACDVTSNLSNSTRAADQDDRDMIVVQDEPSVARAANENRPRRAEYRQLFSRLKGQSR